MASKAQRWRTQRSKERMDRRLGARWTKKLVCISLASTQVACVEDSIRQKLRALLAH